MHNAGVPFERVHMDFIGPLPETTKGNSNILDLWISLPSGLKLYHFPHRQQRKQPVSEVFTKFGCPFLFIVTRGGILKVLYSNPYIEPFIFTKPGLRHIDLQPIGKSNDLIEPSWMLFAVL